MNNLQDMERDLLPLGTEFRDVALQADSGSSSEADGDRILNAASEIVTGGYALRKGSLRKNSGKKTESGAEVIRVIFVVILCSLSILFYSGLFAAKFRAYLSDGFSAVLVYDTLGAQPGSGDYFYDANATLLNILSTPLKKPYPRFTFPYSETEVEQAENGEKPANADIPESLERNANARYYPIVAMDLSSKADGGLSFHNETTYSPDTAALLASAIPLRSPGETADSFGDDAPLVLILHTHGTEAYSPENSAEYDETETFRSEDVSKNIVAVGEVMTHVFEGNGINTIHCTIMHDKDSYRDSYSRSLETIKAFLQEYPSIQYIFDVHRDSVIQSDRTCIRPVTVIDGEEAAQFMTVVGTNFKGADHPNWERNNLALAVHLQTELAGKYDNFVRSINLRSAGFNAQYAPGSLLLEIGTCGNTLSQAKKTAETVAQALSEIILGKSNDDSVEYYMS